MRLTTSNPQGRIQKQNSQMHTRNRIKSSLSCCGSNGSRSRSCCYASVAILICLLASGIPRTNAVPTDSRGGTTLLQRALHDTATVTANLAQKEQPKDTSSTETMLEQPQGQCLLDGVWVTETTVYCEKKVGCRAIQKTGHCCPDYKCDCQKNGTTYSNGDKLVDPATPCTVCYCQGGEILCSSVTCFHRDDCTPKYIPGRCCPEYDNCPVSKNNHVNSSANQTTNTKLEPSPPVLPPGTAFNPNITIKEITKPIEIRITDENKVKSIHQIRKPSTITPPTSAAATTIASKTTTTSTSTQATITSSPTSNSLLASSATNVVESVVLELGNKPDVGKKAVIPERGINTVESLKLSPVTDGPGSAKTNGFEDASSGEDSHEFNNKEIVEPTAVISAFGTEGLQQVEGVQPDDASKVNIKREYLVTTEDVSSASTSSSSKVSTDYRQDLIQDPTAAMIQTGSFGDALQESYVEAEPDVAGSDNVYQIITSGAGSSTSSYTNIQASSSTEGVNTNANEAPTTQEPTHDAELTTVGVTRITEGVAKDKSTASTYHPKVVEPTIDAPDSSLATTDHIKHVQNQHHHSIDDDDVGPPMDTNPAYPSLPEDDFSLRDVNFQLAEAEDTIEVNAVGGKHTADEMIDTQENSFSGSGSDNDADSSTRRDISTTERELAASSRMETVQLMYSAEDSSAETTISNNTDFRPRKLDKLSENETSAELTLESDSLEALLDGASGSGSGSGSGELLVEAMSSVASVKSPKQREYTTPRPTRASQTEVDIDELTQSGDGAGKSAPSDDPKLDAESLKLDESQEKSDNVAKAAVVTADKANIRADKGAEEELVNTVLGPGAGVQRVQRLYLQRVF